MCCLVLHCERRSGGCGFLNRAGKVLIGSGLLQLVLVGGLLWVGTVHAVQDPVIPHAQSKPPNDPYSAEDAAKRMTVPEGFTVEVVACEPDLVNPVAMTFDERGRIWVVESLEYPRLDAGPGRDRIKVLEDRDGDGRTETVTIFAEGLNIPSGIAVGHGGVWIAAAPDLLLFHDDNGDLVADRREVIVTGFGRDDTHELPNSLTFGPDGYLYGLNGVFNRSRIEQEGRVFEFTCAMFRIDPVTRRFELFAEGTSNPWGIAWDAEGSAFLSACVIDHLWHLTETGYYHRQAGAYPPGTWKIESIVDHRHQQAAYCGIHYYDSDAYPEVYRRRLYMGNIHGNCLNVDSLTRNGATYRGHGEDDFLQAHDAWFMPVAQRTGPDGSLYVLDWYDRYHCYQDARRDPEGIDRLKGRLYRIRYADTPRRWDFDLRQWANAQLIEGLGSGNGYTREQCRRLLIERREDDSIDRALQQVVLDEQRSETWRREALWTAISRGELETDFHRAVLRANDSALRAWGVRAAGNRPASAEALRAELLAAAEDESADVRLQAVIAAAKWASSTDTIATCVSVLERAPDDGLTARIVWNAIRVLLEKQRSETIQGLAGRTWGVEHPGAEAVQRGASSAATAADVEPKTWARATTLLLDIGAEDSQIVAALDRLFVAWSGTEESSRGMAWREAAEEVLRRVSSDRPELGELPVIAQALQGEPEAMERAFEIGIDRDRPIDVRRRALAAIVVQDRERFRSWVERWLRELGPQETPEARRELVHWLATQPLEDLGTAWVAAWERWPAEERGSIIEVMTGRESWGTALIEAVARDEVPREALLGNQIRKLLTVADEPLRARIAEVWGTIRETRDPAREQVIGKVREVLAQGAGDPERGLVVFDRVCGQCHRLYGRGAEVGPDLTGNGRGSFEQLLSNVLDPSLVIGSAYQATLVETQDGRVVSGLVIEQTDDRIVLKTQGAETVVLESDEIVAVQRSELSLMPENLESNVTTDELRDLFALLTLDGPLDQANSRRIPGTLAALGGETQDPARGQALISWVLPGFETPAIPGEGLALLESYRGRRDVLRVHPVSRDEAGVLRGKVKVPSADRALWELPVTHDERGDCRIEIRVNGEQSSVIDLNAETFPEGWGNVRVDLARWADQEVEMEIRVVATEWSWEFAYLARPTFQGAKLP